MPKVKRSSGKKMDCFEHYKTFGDHFEIMVGTYDLHSIIGFKIEAGTDTLLSLVPTYAHQSHSPTVNRLLPFGSLLFSGGSDEMIHVYNRNGSAKILMHHEGNITDLQQHKGKFVFSSGEDGKICLYRKGHWQTPRVLSGHRSGVTSLAVHPSGRLLLSGGRDGGLCTWDLSTGERAHRRALKTHIDAVVWSPCGEKYAVVCDKRLRVFGKEGKQEMDVKTESRVGRLLFLSPDLLITCYDSGHIVMTACCDCVWAETQRWQAHSSRVKDCVMLPAVGDTAGWVLVTCSTDGYVKLWGVDRTAPAALPRPLATHDTKCRLTCLGAAHDAAYTGYAKTGKARAPEQVAGPDEEMSETEEEAPKAKRIKFSQPKKVLKAGESEQDSVSIITGEDVLDLLLNDKPSKKKTKSSKKKTKSKPQNQEYDSDSE